MYLVNSFKYLLVKSLLFTGHLPTLPKRLFRVSLSFFSLLHWNIRWSTVCIPCLHGHSALFVIFSRCKYERMLPCPVIIVVTFGLKFNYTASLLSTLGKYSLVIDPFSVSSHCRCHFRTLSSRMSFFIALIGVTFLFLVASFASRSASSFPMFLAWAFTHSNSIFQFC